MSASRGALSKDDLAALAEDERLVAAREAKHWQDQVERAEARARDLRARLEADVKECESALAAFEAASKAVAPLSADTLHRCGAPALIGRFGVSTPSASTVPAVLQNSIAFAKRRLARLRAELDTAKS